MTRALLEQAFGDGGNTSAVVDLYDDVLKCPREATSAQLRKAYYQQARIYHPDKNTVSLFVYTSFLYVHRSNNTHTQTHYLTLLLTTDY